MDSDDIVEGLDPEAGGERVAKILARAGVASRREVERLIEAGRIAVNGHVLTTPAVKVAQGDIVTVDGEVVADAEPARLFRYHKPPGLVTTHNDPKGRHTVFDTLPEGLPRLISIGRLDLNSEGLLLLTNDGELARALELPSNAWARRYRARARGRIDQARLDKLKDGVTVEGVRYGPIEATLDKVKEGQGAANLWITVTLSEGKNREVRRVLEHLGVTVNRLIRLSYGPFALGTLAVGAVEEVGPRVVREQLADFIDPDNMPTGERPQYKAPPSAQSERRKVEAAKQEAALVAAEPPAKKVYKAGWAKPKIKKKVVKAPGSGSAASRPSGPGGRPKSASPRQNSGARPPAPRPGGGPGRRG
ncbi:MAG TPA: pseudouridine synthase [Caulobacteraceae bacterium]